jgi:hypothetical protein
MKYIVGIISILIVIIICITSFNVFNKKEGYENVQDQYLLNQEKYYEGRLSGPALPGQSEVDEFYKFDASKPDGQQLVMTNPIQKPITNDVDLKVKQCKQITSCSELDGTDCGYCFYNNNFYYGDNNGPLTDVCPGGWVKTKEACQERRERAICDKVTNCHDMTGEASICGWCEASNKAFVSTNVGGKLEPKYSQDKCADEGYGLIAQSDCTKFAQEHPCIGPNENTGPHTQQCLSALWKKAGCSVKGDLAPSVHPPSSTSYWNTRSWQATFDDMKAWFADATGSNWDLAKSHQKGCLGTTPNPCDPKYSPRPVECAQQAFTAAGCTSKGTSYPIGNATSVYMGCYKDQVGGVRDLPTNLGNFTQAECAEKAKGYNYFGLQYYEGVGGGKGQCWVGNSYGKQGGSTNCKKLGDGKMYGGGGTNAIYLNMNTKAVTSDTIKAGVTQIKDNMSNSDYNTRAAAAEMCLGTQLAAPPKPQLNLTDIPSFCETEILLGVNTTTPGGGGIYYWTKTGWKRISSASTCCPKSLAILNNVLYATDSNGHIDGWVPSDKKWISAVNVGWVMDITAYNGKIVGIGGNQKGGQGTLFTWTGPSSGWKFMPSSCCINGITTHNNVLYGIGNSKHLWMWTGTNWKEIENFSSSCCVSAIASYDGSLIGIGNSGHLWKWTGTKWVEFDNFDKSGGMTNLLSITPTQFNDLFFKVSTKPKTNDTLHPGATLKRGQSLVSQNGKYSANLQTDGNFCVRGKTSWCLNGVYSGYSNVQSITMQGDGNFCTNTGFCFCQYGYGKQTVWTKQNCGQGAGNYAIIQNDGNFVVYNRIDEPLWATDTN